MLYDLSKEIDKSRARTRFEQLFVEGCKIELTKKEKRTLQQNKYLHLILGWFALEYGETLEYVKQEMFKKLVNADIFKSEYINRKTGEIRESIRSSRDLTTTELTKAIDRFRNWSSKEASIYLPEANEDRFLAEIEIEMERHNSYL
ncbi:MAG: hypothetical protein LBV41_08530 [Cytophagaceae bacterium]|jgi:hypothetical protein|nr:hypothetical protein [Cytophagaceae bacterium]